MIQKESTFKRGGGEQDAQPVKTWQQQIGNIMNRVFKKAKKAQIVYMLGMIMVEGVFYLRRGLVSSVAGSNLDVGCGVYLIALSSSWIFLLVFVPRIQTRFIPLAPSLFIATSSVSMKLQIDPHENNEQISQFQSRDHIFNNQENPSQYNAGGSSSLQCPPGVAGMDFLAKSRKPLNNSNNQVGVAAGAARYEQFSTKDTPKYMQILQHIGVVISASSAIVIMHEQYLRRLTSSEDTSVNLYHFQSVIAIFILMQMAVVKLSTRIVSLLFLVITLGYLLLRSSIHAGFQAESVCLSIIIFLQVVTSPLSHKSKRKSTKSLSGMGSSEPNKKNSNTFHQQMQQFSPKNAQHQQQGQAQQQQFQQKQQQQQQQQQQQELQSPNNDFPILNKQIHYYRKNHTAQIIMQHQSPSSYSKIGEPFFSKQLIPLAKRGNHLLASHSRQTQQQSIQELYFEPTTNNNKHSEFNTSTVQSQHLRHKDSEGSTNSLMRLVTMDQKINKLNLGGFYAQLIGLIPVGIAIISNSNQLLYASSQLLQMLDCKDEQKALKILLTLSTNSNKAPYFAKEQSQPQDNSNSNPRNGEQKPPQEPNLQGDSPPEPEDCRKDTVKEDDANEQIGKNVQDTQGAEQQQQQQDISYLSSHYFQSKHHSSGGGVLQQEGNPIKRANSGMLNGSMKSKAGSDLLADQSPITLSSQNATNRVPNNSNNNNNNNSGSVNNNNNNVKEIISKHESMHGQNKYSNTTTQLHQSQQMHQISAVSFTKFNGSMLTPQNIGIEEDRSSRYFLQNGEDLEDEGQRSRRMSASISAQTLHPPIQANYQQYSKSLLGKDDGASEYCTDRNQYQGTSSAQISPRILSTAPISGGICSTKRSKPKSGQIYNEETEDTLGQFSAYGRKQSLTGVAQKERESAKSIIEEEENPLSGSIVEPSGMISEMQFQPLEQYKNYSSPVTIGRHTQRNISMLRSVRNSSNTNNNNNNNNNYFNTNDTFSENKSEIIQKDESVLNILNTMFGGGIGIDQTPRPSFTRMKSAKKVSVQHASFLPQLSHFSIDADPNNFGSPRLQQQLFMKAQETVAAAVGHQQETNSINKLQREESNPSKQGVSSQEPTKTEKPQDFEDILKQNTKYGYFQQEGNVSIMQIEYLGCQYVLKIIITEVRVGDNGSLQKVAIMVMEKMWQDFLVKRVEDMIQQKMQLFGSLSHELRTPLNCSISMLEVLHNINSSLDQQTQSMMDKYIQPALNSNKLLLNMINDILDFVQLENGSFKFGLIEFDLYALLKECVSLVSIQASMKKLTVACYYDPQTPRIIKSDPNRIRQVILNFLSNSLKFTLQGHIILFASAYKSISEVTIGVKDTGIGINQESIHEIFKAFNKVDLGEKSKLNMQGCGVGLALSNSIAKALGPDSGSERGITVESAKNEGSTFSFLVKNLKATEQQNDKEEDIYENSALSYEHLVANSTYIRHRVTQVFQPTLKDYQIQDSIPTQCSRKHHPHRQPSQSSPKCAAGMIRKKGTTQNLNQTLTKVTGDLGNSSIEDSRQNNNNNLASSNYNNNNNNINNSIGWNEMKARSVSISHASASQKKSIMFPIHTQDLNLNLDGFQLPNIGTPSLLQYPLSAKNNNNTNTNPTTTNNNNNILNNIRTASILESIKSKEFQDMKLLDHSKVEYPDGFNSYMQENSPDCVKRSLESIQNDILSYACSCTQILVVDDQEFNLFSLTELLKQFYNIFSDTALNHEQVLKRISDRLLSNCCKTYKIIFMDINMPNKNGYQVAKMIKQFYSNPKNSLLSLPNSIIIACSAYNGEEDKLRATAAGMTDFVTKPIMKKDLDTIISKYYEVQMQVPLSVLPPI